MPHLLGHHLSIGCEGVISTRREHGRNNVADKLLQQNGRIVGRYLLVVLLVRTGDRRHVDGNDLLAPLPQRDLFAFGGRVLQLDKQRYAGQRRGLVRFQVDRQHGWWFIRDIHLMPVQPFGSHSHFGPHRRIKSDQFQIERLNTPTDFGQAGQQLLDRCFGRRWSRRRGFARAALRWRRVFGQPPPTRSQWNPPIQFDEVEAIDGLLHHGTSTQDTDLELVKGLNAVRGWNQQRGTRFSGHLDLDSRLGEDLFQLLPNSILLPLVLLTLFWWSAVFQHQTWAVKWFAAMLALTISFAVGSLWLWLRGLRHVDNAPTPTAAGDWPRGKLAIFLAIAIALHLMTFWNLDLAARQQLETLRVEAGQLGQSVAPPPVADHDNAASGSQIDSRTRPVA